MKEIKLTQGKVALVDDGDFEVLNKYKWFAVKAGREIYYAARHQPITRNLIMMHRCVTDAPPKLVVDHKDHNGLNNQKDNLRLCTNKENCRNRRKQINNTSGLTGVKWYEPTKKWSSAVTIDNKSVFLGYFLDKNDAYMAYLDGCKKYHKEFANLLK